MFKKIAPTAIIILYACRLSLYAVREPHRYTHTVKRHVQEKVVDHSSSDSVWIIFIVCVVALVYYFKVYLPKKRENEVFNKINNIIEKHKIALSVEREKLLKRDAYGNTFDTEWKQKGIPYFINNVIKISLTDKDLDILLDEEIKKEIFDIVDKAAKDESIYIAQELKYNSSFSGSQYEEFCMNVLKKEGWDTQLTRNKDQGVDIIAQYDSIRVAIQCKHYSNSVGNNAVQQIVAGRNHYNAQYGIVVSNNNYTKHAIELAKSNRIKLIHHNELLKKDFYIG